MLIMDLPTEQVQYFKDFDDMEGQISVKTAYILAPEAEMMPQVELSPGASIRAGRFDVAKSLPQTGQKLSKQKIATIAQAAAKEMAYERGVSDPQAIANITNLIAQEYAKGTDPAKIGKMVYKMFPKTKKPEPTAPAPAKPAQPAPAIAPSAQTAATSATSAPSAQRPVFPRAR
jgi:tryptophan synthase alpha subunit